MHLSRLLLVPGLALALVVQAEAAPIDLPIKTWVKRRLPLAGQGPCPYGCKHMRLAVNPVNGRIYFEGGDYSTIDFYDSGRNETYSYSIQDDTWRLEYPYCGPAGQYQPMHPDEVGWAFDTQRNIFWMVPGYTGAPGGGCPANGATQVRFEIFTFDPVAKTWTWPHRTSIAANGWGNRFAQYDPVSDTIIQVLYNGGPGIGFYDIATDTWEFKWFSGGGDMSEGYSSMDLAQRKIYVVDGFSKKLWRYDMDAKTFAIIADTPPLANETQVRTAWDSANRVLYLVDYVLGVDASLARMHIYHPDTGAWEAFPLTLSEDGGPVYGNHMVYDAAQNALVLLGGDINPARPYFYLFRYGGGSGPADSLAPSAPTNLRPR